MTPSRSLLASLAFWRGLALVLLLSGIALGFILGQRQSGEQEAPWSPEDLEGYAAFLQEAEDLELDQFRRALGRMIEGETEFTTTGRIEEMRRLFVGADTVSLVKK